MTTRHCGGSIRRPGPSGEKRTGRLTVPNVGVEMWLEANLKLGHCPARMRLKLDVAFVQQLLSGGLPRRS